MVGIREGTDCMEHWVWCKNNEYCYTEKNIYIYFISYYHVFQMVVRDDGVGPHEVNLHCHLDHNISVVHSRPVSPFILKWILSSQLLSIEDRGLCSCR